MVILGSQYAGEMKKGAVHQLVQIGRVPLISNNATNGVRLDNASGRSQGVGRYMRGRFLGRAVRARSAGHRLSMA